MISTDLLTGLCGLNSHLHFIVIKEDPHYIVPYISVIFSIHFGVQGRKGSEIRNFERSQFVNGQETKQVELKVIEKVFGTGIPFLVWGKERAGECDTLSCLLKTTNEFCQLKNSYKGTTYTNMHPYIFLRSAERSRYFVKSKRSGMHVLISKPNGQNFFE